MKDEKKCEQAHGGRLKTVWTICPLLKVNRYPNQSFVREATDGMKQTDEGSGKNNGARQKKKTQILVERF